MRLIDGAIAAAFAAIALLAAGARTDAATPDAGRLLASQCAQCHGTNGHAVSGFDSLAGKRADKLFEELLEMKRRPEARSIMDFQTKGYTDEELRMIADYFGAQPRGRP